MRLTYTILVAVAGIASLAQGADPAPIRVLLVTGVDHPAHHWQQSTPIIRETLERGGQFAVQVIQDPNLLASQDLSQFKVIFLHFRNDQPLAQDEAVRTRLAEFVQRGGGLVVWHFACGAFGNWPEFRNLAGKVWDGRNTHDPRGPFTVRIVDGEHPITRGLTDFETDDELYIGLVGERPVHLLAQARSTVTGKDHPMAFAFSHGQGRVFHTPLGHDGRAIRTPGTAELLRRGCLWAAQANP